MVNKHIMHLEEYIIRCGAKNTLLVLEKDFQISLKWDGIGVIAGHAVEDQRFVSSKSFYNKTPKVYNTLTKLEELKPEGLKHKLKHIWLNHPHRIEDGSKINHGDLLWYPGNYTDTDTHRIFRSNIIEYEIPLDMIEGQSLGVVWHTDLVGNGLYRSTDKIWSKHIVLTDKIDWFTLITRVIQATIGDDYTILDQFDQLTLSQEAADLLCDYITNCYQNQKPVSFRTNFNGYFYARYQQIYDGYKSEKGKARATEKFRLLNYLLEQENLECLDKVMLAFSRVKLWLLSQWNPTVSHIKTYVNYLNQRTPVKHEGFVLTMPGAAQFGLVPLKIVDRAEFSRLNRLVNVERGWDK